jgi:hypothetical protein
LSNLNVSIIFTILFISIELKTGVPDKYQQAVEMAEADLLNHMGTSIKALNKAAGSVEKRKKEDMTKKTSEEGIKLIK